MAFILSGFSNLLNSVDSYISATHFTVIDDITRDGHVRVSESNEIILGPLAFIDGFNAKGYQPLHHAIAYGSDDSVSWILSLPRVPMNVAVDDEAWNPVHLAVLFKKCEIIPQLVERGCALGTLDSFNRTPLALAIEKKNLQCIEIISKLGRGNPDRYSRDALSNYYIHKIAQHEELADAILWVKNGLNINVNNRNSQQTALMIAASLGNRQVARKLLEAGALISPINDENGQSALHYAAIAGHAGICELLLLKDPAALPPNYDPVEKLTAESMLVYCNKDGYTPLMLAVLNGHAEAARTLLKFMTPSLVNFASSSTQNTALHLAVLHAQSCRQEIVTLLFEFGADEMLLNADRKSAFNLATDLDLLDIVTTFSDFELVGKEPDDDEFEDDFGEDLKETKSDS